MEGKVVGLDNVCCFRDLFFNLFMEILADSLLVPDAGPRETELAFKVPNSNMGF